MNEKNLFYSIQAGDITDLYRDVTDAALYLAACGYLDEANSILKILWQQGLEHNRSTWLPDLSFEVLWHVKGQRPEFVPFKITDIDSIEKDYREYIGGEHYAYGMPNVEWTQLIGKNAFRQAQIWFSDPNKDESTLFLLEKALQKWEDLAHYELSKTIVMLTEIAAKFGNEPLAIKWAQWGAKKYHDYFGNFDFTLMAQSRHLAPLLLRGILAKPFNLDTNTCQKLTQNIIEAIDKRMTFGRSLVYGDFDWQELLKKLSLLAINDDGEPSRFTDEEKEKKWLGRSKATVKAISDTEKRLGLQLPEDYKAFLGVSNGFSGFSIVPPLLPIEKIDFYKVLEDAELYEITKDYIDTESDDEDATIEPYIERAVLISEIWFGDCVWLIPPINEKDDWQTWSFSPKNPGEHRFESFRHYIEHWVSFFETV